MRGGKKPNNTSTTEASKTRSCVVRLEKVPYKSGSKPLAKSTPTHASRSLREIPTRHKISSSSSPDSSGSNSQTLKLRSSTMPEESKKHIGPLKKRPITQLSGSSGASTPKAHLEAANKLRQTPKMYAKRIQERPSIIEEHIETVAAGRSRRAIKPNPKYSSKDMVTSRIVKTTSPLAKKGGAGGGGYEKNSDSEDFYQHDSSDEFLEGGDSDDLDDDRDKVYKASKESDSDFSDEPIEEPPRKRGRGRPRKADSILNKTAPEPQRSTITRTAAAAGHAVGGGGGKVGQPSKAGQPSSQLLQLRKSLANANAARLANASLPTMRKRKLDTGDGKSYQVVTAAGVKFNVSVDTDGDEEEEEEDDDEETRERQPKIMRSQAQKPITIQPKPMMQTKLLVHPKPQPPQRPIIGTRKPIHALKMNGSKLDTAKLPTAGKLLVGRPPGSGGAAGSGTTPKDKQQQSDSKLPSSQQQKLTVLGSGGTIKQTLPQRALLQSNASNAQTRSGSSTPVVKQTLKPAQEQHKLPVQQQQLRQQQLRQLQHKQQQLRGAAAGGTLTVTRSAAAAASTPKTESPKPPAKSEDDSQSSSHSNGGDDSETMPTFTIVNIHDIINKKGDVLISKTGAKAATGGGKSEPATGGGTSSPDPSSGSLRKSSTNHVTVDGKLLLKKSDARTPAASPQTGGSQPKSTPPTILNHTMFNKSRSPKLSASTEKPVPRILNAMVAKKTLPVQPMITNLDDSADESFPLSMDEEDEEEEDEEEGGDVETNDDTNGEEEETHTDDGAEVDEDATEEEEPEDDEEGFVSFGTNANSTIRSTDTSAALATPKAGSGVLKRRMVSSTPFALAKKPTTLPPFNRGAAMSPRLPYKPAAAATAATASTNSINDNEKVTISRQGNKLIRKITALETWSVINVQPDKPPKPTRNVLELPLVALANVAKEVALPSAKWSAKVSLSELSATSVKANTAVYTGDLSEHQIDESDRARYQPSSVMFRRTVVDRTRTRLPYDRAVIFKNRTFYTNIDGKNVKFVGAPTVIESVDEVPTLLEIMDELALSHPMVEPSTSIL